MCFVVVIVVVVLDRRCNFVFFSEIARAFFLLVCSSRLLNFFLVRLQQEWNCVED